MDTDNLLVDIVEWDAYKARVRVLSNVATSHFGEPETYPCYVKSHIDLETDISLSYITQTILHFFFYPDQAETLLVACDAIAERRDKEIMKRVKEACG